MDKTRIALIGGGASAALLLAHLAQRKKVRTIEIDVYDRTGRFARGVAYSTRHDGHLLNVRAANMSAFQEDKDDFARWTAQRGYTPQDFVPRKLYGVYLSQKMEEAEKNISVRRVEADVLSSRRQGDTYVLGTADGDKTYDRVILASGNIRPLRPRLKGNVEGYYDDPWTADFAVLRRAKRIALVGSGLTAVDMVLALQEEGYEGEIIILSRNALLPSAHVPPVAIPSGLTQANEKQSPLALLRLVRGKIASHDGPWQAVIDSLRPHTNPIWRNWNEQERKRFGKRLTTFWNVHRHRMAPQIAGTVQRLQDSGRLRILKAGVNAIKPGPVIETTKGDMAVDAVINCLGYRYDEEGRQYEVSARIGPACFGDLFETTAIPEIRSQAYELAQTILP